MEIKIWADFACPYCYMGETQLINIIEKEGLNDSVKIKFLSYQIDPKAPVIPTETMTQHFMSGHEYTEEQSKDLMARITKMASRLGLDYNLATAQVCNTYDAHRLMEYVQSSYPQEKAIEFNFSLFHANFIDNLRLSDHSVLLSIAEKCGLDQVSVKKILDSDEYGNVVKAEEKEIDERADFDLVPYMLFDNTTVLQGVISAGAMKKALKNSISESNNLN